MMANQRVSYSSDGEGLDYDPIDNYASASDYEEEPRPQQGLHSIALDKHRNHPDHSDDSDHDEVPSLSHVQVKSGAHPSSVALPESPVSTRGRDSFLERSVRGSNPSSPVSSRGQSSYTFESRLSVNSVKGPTLDLHDDNHSPATTTLEASALALAKETTLVDDPRNSWEENDSDDASYPAAAYDYGQESESSEEDEYEERPRSHQQQQQQQEPHQHTVQEAQTLQEKEHVYDQDLSDYSDDDHDHPPKAHVPIQTETFHRDHDAGSLGGRSSIESYDRRSSYEEDRPVGEQPSHAHVHVDHPVYENDRYSDSDRESDSDDGRPHHNQPDHSDRDSDDGRPQRNEPDHSQLEVPQEQPVAFYDDLGEQPPNPNMFSAADDHRASVNSVKSFSSHTKHHSFGYEDRQAVQEVPSESESESSESEPESEPVQPFVPAPSSHPASPPPIPTISRPTSPRPDRLSTRARWLPLSLNRLRSKKRPRLWLRWCPQRKWF
ncbi:hypothetical protein BGZ70_006615, partial [Mortierella alpina]